MPFYSIVTKMKTNLEFKATEFKGFIYLFIIKLIVLNL